MTEIVSTIDERIQRLGGVTIAVGVATLMLASLAVTPSGTRITS